MIIYFTNYYKFERRSFSRMSAPNHPSPASVEICHLFIHVGVIGVLQHPQQVLEQDNLAGHGGAVMDFPARALHELPEQWVVDNVSTDVIDAAGFANEDGVGAEGGRRDGALSAQGRGGAAE